jgi:diguanylate cyclase (GGDEF)-like protein
MAFVAEAAKRMAIEYSYRLICLSVLLSIMASFAAFSLADRMRQAPTARARNWWLLGGSMAMGIGIWSMHYLGMLAVKLPVDVAYDVPLVTLSLVMAVVASAVVLRVVSAERLSSPRLAWGGLLMAAGIGGMHYTGMAAMRSTAMNSYAWGMVMLSLAAAVCFSWAALWIGFAVRRQSRFRTLIRVAGAAVMGVGIAAMHYIAMAAVTYRIEPMSEASLRWTVKMDSLGEAAVAIAAAAALIGALLTAGIDERRFERLEQAQAALMDSERQLLEANERLSELSIRDGLTGIYNRRHFDEAFRRERHRAAREGLPLALLMIDVDCFKAFNDHYGHQRGDDCLRAIARVLQNASLRAQDIVARYGGEEFAVILPGVDATGAVEVAERLRKAVMALEMAHEESTVAAIATVSIGACSGSATSEGDVDAMLRDADTALYVAKATGRNRVVLAGAVAVAA